MATFALTFVFVFMILMICAIILSKLFKEHNKSNPIPEPLRYKEYTLWSIQFSFVNYNETDVKTHRADFFWPIEPVSEEETMRIVNLRFTDCRVLSAELCGSRIISNEGVRRLGK